MFRRFIEVCMRSEFSLKTEVSTMKKTESSCHVLGRPFPFLFHAGNNDNNDNANDNDL